MGTIACFILISSSSLFKKKYWKAMHGQVSFICSECSGVFGMKGSVENKGSECKREAVSKQASVLHSRIFEAR